MYKRYELKYRDNPLHTDGWNKKAWLATVDGEYIGNIDGSDEVWFKIFAAAGVPEKMRARLRKYKKLLGRISYHNADDHGGEWQLVPPIKDEARDIADELIGEDPEIESVIQNLREGELL